MNITWNCFFFKRNLTIYDSNLFHFDLIFKDLWLILFDFDYLSIYFGQNLSSSNCFKYNVSKNWLCLIYIKKCAFFNYKRACCNSCYRHDNAGYKFLWWNTRLVVMIFVYFDSNFQNPNPYKIFMIFDYYQLNRIP